MRVLRLGGSEKSLFIEDLKGYREKQTSERKANLANITSPIALSI